MHTLTHHHTQRAFLSNIHTQQISLPILPFSSPPHISPFLSSLSSSSSLSLPLSLSLSYTLALPLKTEGMPNHSYNRQTTYHRTKEHLTSPTLHSKTFVPHNASPLMIKKDRTNYDKKIIKESETMHRHSIHCSTAGRGYFLM